MEDDGAGARGREHDILASGHANEAGGAVGASQAAEGDDGSNASMRDIGILHIFVPAGRAHLPVSKSNIQRGIDWIKREIASVEEVSQSRANACPLRISHRTPRCYCEFGLPM